MAADGEARMTHRFGPEFVGRQFGRLACDNDACRDEIVDRAVSDTGCEQSGTRAIGDRPLPSESGSGL
jgi:hypothetical protein